MGPWKTLGDHGLSDYVGLPPSLEQLHHVGSPLPSGQIQADFIWLQRDDDTIWYTIDYIQWCTITSHEKSILINVGSPMVYNYWLMISKYNIRAQVPAACVKQLASLYQYQSPKANSFDRRCPDGVPMVSRRCPDSVPTVSQCPRSWDALFPFLAECLSWPLFGDRQYMSMSVSMNQNAELGDYLCQHKPQLSWVLYFTDLPKKNPKRSTGSLHQLPGNI